MEKLPVLITSLQFKLRSGNIFKIEGILKNISDYTIPPFELDFIFFDNTNRKIGSANTKLLGISAKEQNTFTTFTSMKSQNGFRYTVTGRKLK